MWRAVLHPHPYPLIPWIAVLTLAVWAAGREAQGRRPGAGALALAFSLGLGAAALAAGPAGALEALLAAAALALPYALLSLVSRAGIGDAALMGVVGAWLGVRDGALALLVTSVAGVLYALGYAAARRRLSIALASTSGVARVVVWSVLGDDTGRPGAEGGGLGSHRLPYAPAILAGLMISAAWSLMA